MSSLPPIMKTQITTISLQTVWELASIFTKSWLNDLFEWSTHVMNGAYFPVWTKINKVIDKVEDAKIYRLEDGKLYRRLSVCLDIGSEVAILDSDTAKGFEFSLVNSP